MLDARCGLGCVGVDYGSSVDCRRALLLRVPPPLVAASSLPPTIVVSVVCKVVVVMGRRAVVVYAHPQLWRVSGLRKQYPEVAQTLV